MDIRLDIHNKMEDECLADLIFCRVIYFLWVKIIFRYYQFISNSFDYEKIPLLVNLFYGSVNVCNAITSLTFLIWYNLTIKKYVRLLKI